MTTIDTRLPRGLTLRAYDPAADLAPVSAMLCRVSRHDGNDWMATEAILASEWEATPRFDPARDIIVAEVDGAIVGTAAASWRRRGDFVGHEVSPSVDPAWRRRGIGTALLGAIEARAAAVAEAQRREDRLEHRLAAFLDVVEGAEAFARATGYAQHTCGFVMRRPLSAPIEPRPLPDGLEVRQVEPDQHRAIWDADTEAFRDHAEPAVRDEDDFRHWFSQPDLDTSLWRVAWADDEVAGSVMTTIWKEENKLLGVRRGWFEHVSVRRPWRGQGLASALIADSLVMLRELGIDDAMLGVHAENPTGAVGVYKRAGFRVHKHWALWRKAIPSLSAG